MQNSRPLIQIGILTKGKPTLSMALVSVLLQEIRDIRVHIVDTSETPIINRDDVVFALRLAFDREIECSYEYSPERERAFSIGRLKLLEALQGPHLCFMDDDVVMASSTLSQMLPLIEANPGYGFIAPVCRNAGVPGGILSDIPHYSPGGLIHQDPLVRNILLAYYENTVDVLDQKRSEKKVWEIAFLTELFHRLGRACLVQKDNVVYHLDYHERPNWQLLERRLVRASRHKARELVARFCSGCSEERDARDHHKGENQVQNMEQQSTYEVVHKDAIQSFEWWHATPGDRLRAAWRRVRKYLP